MNYDQKPARAFDTIALLLDIPAGTVLGVALPPVAVALAPDRAHVPQ